MMQPTLAGFMKKPSIEENFQPIVDISHEPVVEIPHESVGEILHESVGGISHEPVGPNKSLHSNLDLNVLIKKDSYEHQSSFFNELEPPFRRRIK
jgi:hypothetical protein